MANHLPIKATRSKDNRSWDFEWDDDALIAQAHVSGALHTLFSCMQLTHAQTCMAAGSVNLRQLKHYRYLRKLYAHVCRKGWGTMWRLCMSARSQSRWTPWSRRYMVVAVPTKAAPCLRSLILQEATVVTSILRTVHSEKLDTHLMLTATAGCVRRQWHWSCSAPTSATQCFWARS